MATLENKLAKNTYKDLLKINSASDNAGIDGTLRSVEDGDATASALQVSTAGIKSTGTLEVTGASTLTGATTIQGLTIGKGGGAISNNTAFGLNALYSNTTGTENSAMGWNALYSNTTGYYNSALGMNTLKSNTTGTENTGIGLNALYFNTTGYYNSALGASALQDNTTGYSNSAMGRSAGSSNTTGANNTFIGYNAQGVSGNANDTITLGNASIATLRCQVTSITALSDKRDKDKITKITEGIDFVKKLNPVIFEWNTRDKAKVGIKATGFIAQDLLELQNQSEIGEYLDLVSTENPEKLEARYSNLLPILVKSIQELNLKIENLEKK